MPKTPVNTPAKNPYKARPVPAIKVGDRIELIYTSKEPTFGPIFHPGDRGTVTGINPVPFLQKRQISVDWDNGHHLMLLEGTDEYRVIEADEHAGGEK